MAYKTLVKLLFNGTAPSQANIDWQSFKFEAWVKREQGPENTWRLGSCILETCLVRSSGVFQKAKLTITL
jgi:hypothetical protein